jgi:hypothetical protein
MTLTLRASDSPLSLADFYAAVAAENTRGGRKVYTVKIRVNRDDEWIPAGMLELLEDEWLRLYAVLNAHKAATHGTPLPKIYS